MEEFVRAYGLWILLGVVFIAMHRFGMGCGGGHDHGSKEADGPQAAEKSSKPGEQEKPTTTGRAGGCH